MLLWNQSNWNITLNSTEMWVCSLLLWLCICLCLCAFTVSWSNLDDLLVYIAESHVHSHAFVSALCLLTLPVLRVWWVSGSAMSHLSSATASCGYDWVATRGAGMGLSLVETRWLYWPCYVYVCICMRKGNGEKRKNRARNRKKQGRQNEKMLG